MSENRKFLIPNNCGTRDFNIRDESFQYDDDIDNDFQNALDELGGQDDMDAGCLIMGGAGFEYDEQQQQYTNNDNFKNMNSDQNQTHQQNLSDSEEEDDGRVNLDEFDDVPPINNVTDNNFYADEGEEEDLDALALQMEYDINNNNPQNLNYAVGDIIEERQEMDSLDEGQLENVLSQRDQNRQVPLRDQYFVPNQSGMEIVKGSERKNSRQIASSYFDLAQLQIEKEELNRQKSEWARTFRWDEEVDLANQHIFQNQAFRENQREIINATKSGQDVLALIPTGGGKSLTFQLSAVTDKGVTIVVMPLLSLIEDNFQFVIELGIPSCNLSSTSSSQKEERRITDCYRDIKDLKYKLVYLTPEKLVKSPGLMSCMDHLYSLNLIDRFVIDEVHCVSHWGQDFRKDYLHLDMLKKRYPKVPLLCLTATATLKVKDDIIKRLSIKDVVCFQSSFNRTNLVYEIRDKKQFKNVTEDIVNLLRTRFKGKCGIIYCISRKECEKLSEILKRNYMIKCDYYHAELTYNKRKDIQEKWMKNELQIIIATIAFGMGINKKDVRFVIHNSMPKSLEGYVQECGRAGRDQQKAECILYYQYSDRKRNDFFIVTNNDNTSTRKNENVHALYSILQYCEEPFLCRRMLQLKFLGEEFDASKCKMMCDNCRQDLEVKERTYNKEAKTLVQFVQECHFYKQQISYKQAIEVLRGKKQKKQFLRADKMEYYLGRLKYMDEKSLRRLVIHLLIQRILKESFQKQNIRGINVQQISVYLIPGRQEYVKYLMDDHLDIMMSEGIRKDKKVDFQQPTSQLPTTTAMTSDYIKPLGQNQNQYNSTNNNRPQNNQHNQMEVGGRSEQKVREEFKQQMEEGGRRNYVKQKTTTTQNNISNNYAADNNYGFGKIESKRNDDDQDVLNKLSSSNNNNQNNNNNYSNDNRLTHNTIQANNILDSTIQSYGYQKQQYNQRNLNQQQNQIQNQAQIQNTDNDRSIKNNNRQQQRDVDMTYDYNNPKFDNDYNIYANKQNRESSHQNSLDSGGIITSQNNNDLNLKPQNQQLKKQSASKEESFIPIIVKKNDERIVMPSIPFIKLDEILRQELRQRLYLIRNRLLSDSSESEHLAISKAFTDSGFQLFLSFAEQNLNDNSQEILNQLKNGKNQSERDAIDKYGVLFLMEFNHFITSNKIHLQIDHKRLSATCGGDLDNSNFGDGDLNTTREDLQRHHKQQQQQFDNYFSTQQQKHTQNQSSGQINNKSQGDDFFNLNSYPVVKNKGGKEDKGLNSKTLFGDEEHDQIDLEAIREVQTSSYGNQQVNSSSANMKFKSNLIAQANRNQQNAPVLGQMTVKVQEYGSGNTNNNFNYGFSNSNQNDQRMNDTNDFADRIYNNRGDIHENNPQSYTNSNMNYQQMNRFNTVPNVNNKKPTSTAALALNSDEEDILDKIANSFDGGDSDQDASDVVIKGFGNFSNNQSKKKRKYNQMSGYKRSNHKDQSNIGPQKKKKNKAKAGAKQFK